MARLKKAPTENASPVALATSPDTEPNASPLATKFFGESNGSKHKGKAPSQKTLLVRAAIAEFPDMMPKLLAEKLNEKHPGFDFKNIDVSQQKLQLQKHKGKTGKKRKTSKVSVETVVAPTTKVSVAKAGADIKHLADLAKKLGTPKIRELCDLIDYLA